jgi:hypothetical protein
MKKLKQLWNYLNGKKTSIGLAVMLTAQAIQVFAPNLMAVEQTEFLQTLGALIGGFGLVHKGTKTETAQKLLHYKTKPSGK